MGAAPKGAGRLLGGGGRNCCCAASRRASCCRSRGGWPIDVGSAASTVAEPAASASASSPASDILRMKRDEGGAGTKCQNWRLQQVNEVKAKRADFWGVNALLDRVEGRKCNSRPGKRADTAEKRSKRAGWPPRGTRRDVQGVQRCHPLQVHYVLRGPMRRDPAHLFSSAWQAGESKRADRRRRRLYFYSRSAISRSAAHLETEETPLLLW